MGSAALPAWVYLPALLMAFAGTWVVLRALLLDRSRGRRRCPSCWYDMSGVTSLRCPECGQEARAESGLLRTRRHWMRAGAGAALIFPLMLIFGVRDARRVWYALPPKWVSMERVMVDSFLAKSYKLRNPDDVPTMLVRVWSGGTKLMEAEDYSVRFGLRRFDPNTYAELSPIGAPQDLNLDGVPELLVVQFSGGAHCCYTVTLFTLTEPAQLIGTINAVNGMAASALPTGEVLLNIPDQSFDYWKTGHAGSPQPDVLYRLTPQGLVIALDEMLRSGDELTPQKLSNLRTSLSLGPGADQLDSDLWRVMLQLMYAGRESEAWEFFDRAWPEQMPGKDQFKAEFLDILAHSRQWMDFSAAMAARAADAPLPRASIADAIPDQ